MAAPVAPAPVHHRHAGAEGPRLKGPALPFHSPRLTAAWARLPAPLKANWAWWGLDAPPRRNLDLAALLEPDVPCFDEAEAQTLLAMLSPLHRARLEAIQASGERRVGAAFRRVRTKDGRKLQRLELRFDGLAGCLRTPRAGRRGNMWSSLTAARSPCAA
ncbi:hypothetical protein V8F63_06485 [Brevundimonas sp. LF-1]|uniref:hypothetical protein n=1 Tax=Brevundimonas sp. LF-1 TaxID=3126100 RepID=UPI0030DED382